MGGYHGRVYIAKIWLAYYSKLANWQTNTQKSLSQFWFILIREGVLNPPLRLIYSFYMFLLFIMVAMNVSQGLWLGGLGTSPGWEAQLCAAAMFQCRSCVQRSSGAWRLVTATASWNKSQTSRICWCRALANASQSQEMSRSRCARSDFASTFSEQSQSSGLRHLSFGIFRRPSLTHFVMSCLFCNDSCEGLWIFGGSDQERARFRLCQCDYRAMTWRENDSYDLFLKDGRALADVWRSTDGASWLQANCLASPGRFWVADNDPVRLQWPISSNFCFQEWKTL